MSKHRAGEGRRQFYVGVLNGRIHFYRDTNYYSGVRKADLFSTEKAAKQCYEKVLGVTVERLPKKVGRGK
jgi:hypothetical protein